MASHVGRESLDTWILAARPHTLPAAAAPVLVGTGIAIHHDVFALLPAIMALVGAALIQIGTNFANDYYDAKRGADTEDREGFTRVTQSGLIEPRQVKRAAFLTFGVAILSGLYLVYIGGLPILLIGLISVFCGWAYTGGPYPLGYHGLGDLFVFVFFGIVAVTGTYYVQAVSVLASPLPTTIPSGTVTWEPVIAGVAIGALATAILVVNNIRDIDTDTMAGKRTLAVRLGYRWSRIEFIGLLGLAYVVPLVLIVEHSAPLLTALPLVTVPYGYVLTLMVLQNYDGETLNLALEQSGRLLAAYAMLFTIGVSIG